VPSEKVWKKYLMEQEVLMGTTIDFINFRDKERYGWKSYAMTLQAGKKRYTKTHTDDVFMKFFLKNIDLRPSCHECRFKEIYRNSDLTLGDCWSIRRYNVQMDDDKGISVILIYTEKGEELIKRIQYNCKLERVDADKVLPLTTESRKAVSAHPERQSFFELLNSGESLKKLQKMVDDPVYVKAKRKLARIKRRILKGIIE